MPDKKLTAAEIEKAVKSHEEKLLANGLKCLEPFEVREILERQQEEINRQKEEIERLKIAFNNQTLNTKYWRIRCDELVEENLTAKAEAVKEFAERLKENFEPLNSPLINNRIDNLLKEMVGEDK